MHDISGLEDVILRTGALCAAFSAVIGLVVLLVRMMILKPLDVKLSAHSAAIESQFNERMCQHETAQAEQFRRVEYELKANGGGSLRDDVRATRKQVERIHTETLRHHDGLVAWAKALRHDLERVNICVQDPDEFSMTGTTR